MPGFDPEKIPTLDDIIEEDATEKTEKAAENSAVESVDTGAEEFDINRFLAETQSVSENTATDEPEPRLGDMAGIALEEPDDPDVFVFDDSATDLIDDAEIDLMEYFEDDDYHAVETEPDEPAPPVSVEPISVGPLVKNIVRELMPDIEQQLVFMLQKAIEEKLPEELIKPADPDNDKDNEG